MAICNTTLEDAYIVEEALWHNVTWHHIGLFISAIFGLISILISLFLIFQHATHYLRPDEQRHIIRILFMIPVYSLVSFLSYMFYRKAVYFEVLRDCYEAFAISSFFALLCHYIAPNLHDQKDYFRSVKPVNWFWGVFGLQHLTGGEDKGFLRRPRSGLTWFNVIWAGIFQYCFVRVFFTIVSVVSEIFGRYCATSLNPAFSHIWVLGFESLSVTVAMFMVVQFYIQLKDDLVEHRPFLKVLSIKLVIFFSFWQTIVISFLSSESGPLKPTKTLAYQDIKIGIPSVMLCIEMAAFSIMHIFAYSWKPYRITGKDTDAIIAPGPGFSGLPEYKGGRFGFKAVLDTFNPSDIIKASARGFRWMFVGAKHRHADVSYHPAKLSEERTGYMGPTFAATELNSGRRRGRADTLGIDTDRVGLLGVSAAPGRGVGRISNRIFAPTGYESVMGGDGSLGLEQPPRSADPYAMSGGVEARHSECEKEDTRYHPRAGPLPDFDLGTNSTDEGLAAREGQAAPAYANWNHWADVRSSHAGEEDSHSVCRPPTFRRHDHRV